MFEITFGNPVFYKAGVYSFNECPESSIIERHSESFVLIVKSSESLVIGIVGRIKALVKTEKGAVKQVTWEEKPCQ